MADLLMQVSNPDRIHDVGDIICWKPEGGSWGKAELIEPNWYIVRVPGLTEAEADALCATELPKFLGDTGMRLREMTVNTRALSLIRNDVRSGIPPDLIVDLTTFRTLYSVKPPRT